MRVPDGVPRQTKTTRFKALKTRNQADDVACERPHQNHDGLHLVVLFDLQRITPGGLRMTAEARMHGSDVAVGVRDRARRRHSRGALSVALRQPHGVGHLARSGVIEAQNPADNVAYEGCHRNHRGRLLVAFFDVPRGCLRVAFGRPPQLGCVAASSQEECAFGLVVVAAVWCSRFASGAGAGRAPNAYRGVWKAMVPESKTEGKIKGMPLI